MAGIQNKEQKSILEQQTKFQEERVRWEISLQEIGKKLDKKKQ